MDIKKMLDELILVFLNKLTSIGLQSNLLDYIITINTIPHVKIVTSYSKNFNLFDIVLKYDNDIKLNYYISDAISGFKHNMCMINIDFYKNNTDYINDIIIDELIRYLMYYKNIQMFYVLSKQNNLIFNDLEFHIRKIKLGEIDELCN